jgi:hypothetical protein
VVRCSVSYVSEIVTFRIDVSIQPYSPTKTTGQYKSSGARASRQIGETPAYEPRNLSSHPSHREAVVCRAAGCYVMQVVEVQEMTLRDVARGPRRRQRKTNLRDTRRSTWELYDVY